MLRFFYKIGILTIIYLSMFSVAIGQSQDLMQGFKRLLPRDGIPSIKNPTYVTVEEANIDDDAWIMGVVINGEARAYSLNILNHHEIVNDKINDSYFAAVW